MSAEAGRLNICRVLHPARHRFLDHNSWKRPALFCAVCLTLLAPAHGRAQSNLPATAPTAVTPSQLPSANPPMNRPAGRQEVSWIGAQLQVVADNASLNAVLREIAAKANLTIAGSVPEERVFGTYGPGSLDTVLPQLLDGQSVNMVLVDHTGAQQKELVLTARSGGVTPPRPQYNASTPVQTQQTQQQIFQPVPEPATRAQNATPAAAQIAPPAAGQNNTAATPAGNGNGQDGTGAASGAGDAAQPISPNGVRTPQQIFEQLQRIRQQGQGASQ